MNTYEYASSHRYQSLRPQSLRLPQPQASQPRFKSLSHQYLRVSEPQADILQAILKRNTCSLHTEPAFYERQEIIPMTQAIWYWDVDLRVPKIPYEIWYCQTKWREWKKHWIYRETGRFTWSRDSLRVSRRVESIGLYGGEGSGMGPANYRSAWHDLGATQIQHCCTMSYLKNTINKTLVLKP